MTMRMYNAVMTKDEYEVICAIQVTSSDILRITATGAKMSLRDCTGIVLPEGAVLSACLSGMRFDRKSLREGCIKMKLCEIKGEYPSNDMTELATCISKVISKIEDPLIESNGIQCESDTWKIRVNCEQTM